MAAIQLTAGQHTLTLPITASPAGQPCSVVIYLTSDPGGANVVAQSQSGEVASFTSTGASQNVAPKVTIPAGGASLYVFILGAMNGATVAYQAQSSTVTVPGFVIGQGTWS